MFKLKKRMLAASYTKKGSDIRTLFRHMDTDHSGTLDLLEVGHMVKRLIPDVTDRQLKYLLKEIDADGNGTIDEDELIAFITDTQQRSSPFRAEHSSNHRRSASLEPARRRQPTSPDTGTVKIDRNVIAALTYRVTNRISIDHYSPVAEY